MKEKWKPINGYDNKYFISNKGNVLSNKGVKPRLLKPILQSNGYYVVSLSKGTKTKITYIHRLLALYFIKNLLNKDQVNHIDGNKTNNDLSNLEWATQKENSSHASKIGLYKSSHGENHYLSKLTSRDIYSIRSIKNKTQKEIAKIFNIDQSNVSYILSNKTWK